MLEADKKHIPPNILAAMKMKFDHGDPMDYTWVDLGDFESMSDEVYKKAMTDIPNPFHVRPEEALLPFEKMGMVRKTKKGVAMATTIERENGVVLGTLRGSVMDFGAIRNAGDIAQVKIPEQFEDADEVVEWLRNNGVPDANKQGMDPRDYLYQIWGASMSHQFAEYMRKAQDMHERVKMFKATPSAKHAAINAKRIRKGKQPLYDWSVIDVTAKQKEGDIVATGTARTSPRQHKRRGHFRHFKDGRKVWINEMLVGKIEFGYTYHSYTTGG